MHRIHATILLALVPLAAPAEAQQTVPVVSAAQDAQLDVATGTQIPMQAQATVYQWTPRLPLDPAVELTEVVVTSSVEFVGTVTVTNPTSSVVDGRVDVRYGAYSLGGTGDWGGFDADDTTAGLAASGMQPGETRTLPTWTYRESTANSHIEMSGDPWSNVQLSVLGNGRAAYTVSGTARFTRVTGGLEIVSASLSAEAIGDMSIRGRLSPASGVTEYCTGSVTPSGMPAALAAFGAPSPGSTGFSLLASHLPPHDFAVVIGTTGAASVPTAGGTLCIGGSRIFQSEVILTPATGQVLIPTPLADAMNGTTVYLQGLFRAPGGFGLTNALAVPL